MWVGVSKKGFTLCKKNKVITIVRIGVTGYQDLCNQLHILKMALEVC